MAGPLPAEPPAREDASAGADPVHELADALQPMLAPDAGVDARELSLERAKEILDCVEGDHFDSSLLRGGAGEALLAHLPAAGWAALQRHALTKSEVGIRSLTLSPVLAAALNGPDPVLVHGIGQLPALVDITLRNPPPGFINLRGLCGVGPGRVQNLSLECESAPSGPWTLHVPDGVTVVGNPLALAVPGSTVVCFQGDILVKELDLGMPMIGRELSPQEMLELERRTYEDLLAALSTNRQLANFPLDRMQAAQDILACLDGNRLDVSRLAGSSLFAVLVLPVAGWQALQDLAIRTTGRGITSVSLSGNESSALEPGTFSTLVAGLRALPQLQTLALHDPPNSSLNFSALASATGRLSIEIHSQAIDPGPWKVTVAPGVRVCANARHIASQPSSVVTIDRQGGETTQVLEGLIYHRKPTDFAMDAQAARALNLNGKGSKGGSVVWCNRLALQWLDDRAAHRLARQEQAGSSGEAPPGRFAYTRFRSTSAISSNIAPDANARYDQMRSAGPRALFSLSQFGDCLAQEFEDLVPGQTRQLFVESVNHAMGVELRVKDGQYVVNFYDPNNTAMHLRVAVSDPAMLRGRPLDDWLEPHGRDAYFGVGRSCLGSIYRVSEQATAPVPVGDLLRHVSVEHRNSPQGLFFLYASGHEQEAALVEQEMKGFLTTALERHTSGEIDNAQLQALVMERFGGMAEWWMSSYSRVNSMFMFYLNWIIHSPLDHAQKAQLLSANGRGGHGLSMAVFKGRADSAAAYALAVANAPDGLLDRRQLLTLHAPGSAPHSQSLLHYLAAEGITNRVPGVFTAISRFVRVIAASSLPLDDKAVLCGGVLPGYRPGTRTAVQLALDSGHPLVAAAIATAIWDMRTWQRGTELQEKLQIDMDKILDALKKNGDMERFLAARLELMGIA